MILLISQKKEMVLVTIDIFFFQFSSKSNTKMLKQ